mgnify:CR=1 FL=1
MLISYAIGTLLGAAFLEILPHAFELSPSAERVSATVLIGILLFFVLEKLMLVASSPRRTDERTHHNRGDHWPHRHDGDRRRHVPQLASMA